MQNFQIYGINLVWLQMVRLILQKSRVYEHLINLARRCKVIMNIIATLEKEGLKENAGNFNIGDTVKVFVKVVEGDKERLQAYEGVVIARKNGSIRETFTVRRISFGVGVERTFPVHSPRIDHVEVVRKGKVRRAKLYYVRKLSGKRAKIKEAI